MTHEHDDLCPSCGEPQSCGHAEKDLGKCHNSVVTPCCMHFQKLHLEVMVSVHQPDSFRFINAVHHLNGDGWLRPAWFTWMAMVGRYALPEGADPLTAMAPGAPEVADTEPAYVHAAAPLINYATRAAVAGDWDMALATLDAAAETLDAEAMLCFLKSCAVSAHVVAEINPAATTRHLTAYGVLGSQIAGPHGPAALPLLVDMVVAQQDDDRPGVIQAFHALYRDHSIPVLASGVDMLMRALGQLVAADAWVLGHSRDESLGIVDVETATAATVPDGMMPAVWAVRAARSFHGATTQQEGLDGLNAVMGRHGSPSGFAQDVLLAGTQILAGVLTGAD